MARRRKKRRKRLRARPELIGPLLENWLRKEQLLGEMRVYRLLERWPQLVGERVARRARPTRVHRGRLIISVANSAWLNELSFLKEGLVEQLNEQLGSAVADDPITEIRLVIGRVSWRPRPLREPPPPPTPPARDAIERALTPLSQEIARHGDLDGELVAAIERARRMQLASATR